MGNNLKRLDQDRHVRYVNEFINKKAKVQKTPEYTLLTASKENNIAKMKKLINNGVDVNCAVFHEDEIKTALHIAAKEGHTDATQLLIESGCDVNLAPSDIGAPPLLLACSSQSVEIVKLLLQAGPCVNQMTKFGHTSLLAASAGGNLEIVRLLLEYGADIDHMSDSETTSAVAVKDVKLSERTENPLFGNTGLMHACLDHRLSCVKELVTRGCSLNLQNNYGNTALHIASFSRRSHRPHRPVVAGHPKIVTELVEHGANLSLINIFGETPLHRALNGACILADMFLPHVIELSLMQDFLNIATHLVREGCDATIWDNRGQSALTHALHLNFIIANRKQDSFAQDTAHLLQILVRKLHYAGCHPDVVHRFTNATDELSVHVQTVRWLLDRVDKPYTLREICRMSVRKSLQKPISKFIKLSPLPLQMQAYVLMDGTT